MELKLDSKQVPIDPTIAELVIRERPKRLITNILRGHSIVLPGWRQETRFNIIWLQFNSLHCIRSIVSLSLVPVKNALVLKRKAEYPREDFQGILLWRGYGEDTIKILSDQRMGRDFDEESNRSGRGNRGH